MTVDEKFVLELQNFTNALGGITDLLTEESKKGTTDPVNKMLSAFEGIDLGRVVADLQKVVKTTDSIQADTKEILKQLKANKEKKEASKGTLGEVSQVDNKQKILDAIKVIGLITVSIVAMGLALKIISPVSMASAIGIGLAIVFVTGAFVAVHKFLGNINQDRMFQISKMMLIISATLLATSLVLSIAPTISFGKAMSLTFVAVAMGTALVLITKAIDTSKIKPEHYPKMLMLPIILPVIAIGIAISSFILSRVVPMTFPQVLTTIMVAGAIGVSLFLIGQSLDKAKLNLGSVGKFLLLPLIIPALALGIVVAASILSGIKPITFGQALSAIFVAGAIGILIYLMKPAIDKMKSFDYKEVLGVMALVIALSVGIVAASWILSKVHLFTFGQSIRLIMTSVAIGISVLMLTPAVYLLKSLKTDDALQAAKNIIILSGAIAVSSWLLSFGNYDNYPTWKWAFGAGLSLTMFAGASLAINKLGMKPNQMVQTGLVIVAIATTIFLTSQILSFGDYDNYPSLGWSIGVGLSLVAFGAGMVVLGKLMQSGGMWTAIGIGAAVTLGVAATIMLASLILNKGEYKKYPTLGWSLGVGLSLIAFGAGMIALGLIMQTGVGATALFFGALATIGVATTMAAASWIIGLGNYSTYPDFDWAAGVGLSLITFGGAMAVLGFIVMTGVGLIAMGLGALAVMLVAGSIVAVSFIVGSGNYEDYPSLAWSLGVGLSLVAFGGAMLVLGFGLPLLFLGSLSMKLIANTIAVVSRVISGGDYEGGPSLDWSKGVGSLMGTFASIMISTAFIPNRLLERSAEGILIIAQNVVDVASVLNSGDYSGGPDKKWADTTTSLISTFAKAGTMLSFNPFVLFGLNKMYFVAQAIVDVSKKLSEGTYTGGPTKEWAEGVGLSIKAFAEGIAAMQATDNFFSIFGENQGKKIVDIADAMLIANQKLSGTEWGNYPSKEWAEGVGLSIKAFAEGLAALQSTDSLLGGLFGEDENKKIVMLASAMLEANKLLGGVTWGSHPTKEWAEGVGTAIKAFAGPLAEMSEADMSARDIRKGIRALAWGMMEAAFIFSLLDWSKYNNPNNYPSIDWSEGVSAAINAFAEPLAKMSEADMSTRDIKKGINRLATAMVDAAYLFGSVNWDVQSYPSIEWAEGVGASIGQFVKYLIEIEKNDIGRGEIKNLKRVVDAMVSTAMIFKIYDLLGIWDSYPPIEWSQGVGNGMGKFMDYLVIFKENEITDSDIKNLKRVVNTMVSTALIFKAFEIFGIWDSYPPVEWSQGVGNGMGKFVDYLVTFKEYGIEDDDIKNLNRIVSIMVSTAMVFTHLGSEIWKTYPPVSWSNGISSGVGKFVDYLIILNQNNITDEDIKNLNRVVGSIITTALRFDHLGTEIWKTYPPTSWSASVGESVGKYVNYVVMLRESGVEDGDIKILNTVINMMMITALTFTKLGSGIWNVYPPIEWSTSVGNAIGNFVDHVIRFKDSGVNEVDIKNLEAIVNGMIMTAQTFTKLGPSIWTTYPSSEWSQGVASAIEAFVDIESNGNEKVVNDIINNIISIAQKFTSLGEGIWKTYPSTDWTDGVGNAINVFTKIVVDLATIDPDLNKVNKIIDAMISAATTFTSLGDSIWKVYPTVDWATGVNMGISEFVYSVIQLEGVSDLDIKNVNKIIDVMTSTAQSFTKLGGKIWETYPSKDWAIVVGGVVSIFTKAIVDLSSVGGNTNLLDSLASSIISFASKISQLAGTKAFEKGGVIENFSLSIKNLVDSLPTTQAAAAMDIMVSSLERITALGDMSTNSILSLSKSVAELGKSFQSLDMDAVVKLSKLSNGILVLSLIDDKKLEDTIKTLKTSKNEIGSILSDQGRIAPTKIYTGETIVENRTSPIQSETSSDKDKFYSELLTTVKSIDKNVGTIASNSNNESDEDDSINADGGVNVNADRSANPLKF